MTNKPSSSLAGLISLKGTAAAAVPTTDEPIKPLPEQSQPAGGQSYWKAMTVKLTRSQYVQLKIHGVELNKSSQLCISEAIDLWLTAQRG